jgi:hypothetical protein
MHPIVAPLIMGGLSALGGIFGNKKQTQTSMPKVNPAYTPIQQALISSIMERLRSPSSLPSGYEAGQIRDINNTYGLAGQNLSNRLTARGLGSSPVAATGLTNMGIARAGQISTMQGTLPLLERQMQNEDLSMAGNVLRTGMGQETTTPSNMVGGAFTSAANMLAFLYGQGSFTPKSGSTVAAGGGVTNIPGLPGVAIAPPTPATTPGGFTVPNYAQYWWKR